LCDVTVVATQKTDAKTSRLVCHLTEIALVPIARQVGRSESTVRRTLRAFR